MKKIRRDFALILSAVSMLGLLGCNHDNTDRKANPIVGAWFVNDPGAPFHYHMYVFNAGGTMQQANPDAGDPRSSDSDGKEMTSTHLPLIRSPTETLFPTAEILVMTKGAANSRSLAETSGSASFMNVSIRRNPISLCFPYFRCVTIQRRGIFESDAQ